MKFRNPFRIIRKRLSLKNSQTKQSLMNFNTGEIEKFRNESDSFNEFDDLNSDSKNLRVRFDINFIDSSRVRKYSRGLRKISMITNILRKSVELKRIKIYSKTTRMLLLISTTFLVLNSPIGFAKVRYYFLNNHLLQRPTKTSHELNSQAHLNIFNLNSTNSTQQTGYDPKLNTNDSDEIIERFTCYIYYLNFSLNFLLYVFNGPKFRKSIIEIFLDLKKNFRI